MLLPTATWWEGGEQTKSGFSEHCVSFWSPHYKKRPGRTELHQQGHCLLGVHPWLLTCLPVGSSQPLLLPESWLTPSFSSLESCMVPAPPLPLWSATSCCLQLCFQPVSAQKSSCSRLLRKVPHQHDLENLCLIALKTPSTGIFELRSKQGSLLDCR